MIGIGSARGAAALVALVAVVSSSAAAWAEVLSAGPAGFNIRHVVDTPNAPAPTVWAALSDIARWWDPEHTYSGNARNLSLDPVVLGCFCEKLSLYAGVEHARVVYALPAKTLRLSGALGPLQPFGVTGSLTWQIDPVGAGSRITMTYNVGGFADRPLAEWAPLVDAVMVAQTQRLASLVNSGNPEPAKPQTK